MNSAAEEMSATDSNTDKSAYITELKEKLITLTDEETVRVIAFVEALKNQRTAAVAAAAGRG